MSLARVFRIGLLAWFVGVAPEPGRAVPPVPYFDAGQHQVQYHGPGRDTPTPEGIEEVLIGYFGPTDPHHPTGSMWRAAQAAVAQANRQGGYQGKPFRLLSAWAKDPWGGGVKQLAHLVYVERIWAIICGVDGATAHLAEQVAAKARLPLINAASTDKTVNLANVPWVFSLAPGDHLICPPLAAAIVEQAVDGRFTLMSATDHDSRELTRQLTKALHQQNASASYRYEFRRGEQKRRELVSEVIRAKPTVVVVVADADDSAHWVTGLREQGFQGTILGGPAMGRHRFSRQAGEAAEGVVFPLLLDPASTGSGRLCKPESDEAGETLSRTSETSFDRDYTTDLAGDAVRLLVEAVGEAGLNRVGIRDALAEISPWQGRAGIVQWDTLGRNTREVALGTISRSPVHAPRSARPAKRGLRIEWLPVTESIQDAVD